MNDIDGVKQLLNESDYCFICTGITFHDGNGVLGGFHIKSDCSKMLAEIGLDIDFDLYAFGERFKETD